MGPTKLLAISICLPLVLLNCSVPRPSGKTKAEVLYKEAKVFKEDGHYLLAIEKLNRIRSQYPYSYFATHAELLHADVLFAQQNYSEAQSAYLAFKNFHPKHKRLPYVLWKIGESSFEQMPSTYDRDLESALSAIKYFEMLIQLYPHSKYITAAKKKVAFCRKQLELKDRSIADFYYKTSAYRSALFRYLKILETRLENQELRDHSMVRVVSASVQLKEKESCKKHYHLFKKKIKDPTFQQDLEKAYEVCLQIKDGETTGGENIENP